MNNNLNNSSSGPPLVSIITVTLNNAAGLANTVNSVARQTYRVFEFIVIDGGSSDGTLEIIKESEEIITTWISEPDLGIYDAMNKGLSLASGIFVNFLNAGDTYAQTDTLERIFGKNGDGYDIIYGDVIVSNLLKKDAYLQKAMPFNRKLLLKYGTGVVCHQAVFIRRSLAPYYELKWHFKSELNWYFDILESETQLKIHQLEFPLINYTVGGYGYINFWHNQKEWLNLVRARFGWSSVFYYLIPIRIVLKLPYRYPWLLKVLFRKQQVI